VGDSCLFHVRDGRAIAQFPIASAAEMEDNPVVIGSVDLKRDNLVNFKTLDVPCQVGDMVVLCTDAIAAWAMRLGEAGEPPDWDRFWNTDPEAWREEIVALRDARKMRFDDATLALLRVTDREPPIQLDPAPSGADEIADELAALDASDSLPVAAAPEEMAGAGPEPSPPAAALRSPAPAARVPSPGLPAPPARLTLPPRRELPDPVPLSEAPPPPPPPLPLEVLESEEPAADSQSELDWLKAEQQRSPLAGKSEAGQSSAWKDKLKSLGDQVSRRLEKLKEVKKSMTRKDRDKK
jgi:hypothetical protein